MAIDKASVGRHGEQAAADLLKSRGYRILEQNYRCRFGEVDIIAADGETIIFVEVKTRSSMAFGTPAASVDERKQRRIILASTDYLGRNGLEHCQSRFDVVGVVMKGGRTSTEHFVNAFDADIIEDF